MQSKRILVVRNDRLGDLILALPLLRALRRGLPGCFVGVLASAYASPLLENHPDVDAFVIDQTGVERELKQLNFDTALVLLGSWKNAWKVFRAGISQRVGSSRRPYACLFNRWVQVKRSQGTQSEALYNQEFLKPLALRAIEEPPRVYLKAGELKQAQAWLKVHKLAPEERRPLVVLHPGSGGSAYNWKPARYAELGRLLAKKFRAKLLVSGGPAEGALMEQVAGLTGLKPVVMQQTLPLRVFAAVLSQAQLFVSGSTGPMHVAAACGTPTLSFFPPLRPMSALRWGPLGNTHAVLTPAGLGLSDRALPENVMDMISVNEALRATETLFAISKMSHAKAH